MTAAPQPPSSATPSVGADPATPPAGDAPAIPWPTPAGGAGLAARGPAASPYAAAPCALTGVTMSYALKDQRIKALDDVTIAFEPGRWTAVMGPSGSGKSTLLLVAAGLLRPDAGTVVLAGHDLATLSERERTVLRRDQVGFIFQSLNLVPSLTAERNVVLPLALAGRRPARGQGVAALAHVGLAERARHRPDQLSGGQQQRVAIARALVMRPQVLFADEPTGALDSASSAGVLDLFRELTDAGSCVVMVTHDPLVAARADRVVYLRDGAIVAESAADDATAIAARLARLEAGAAA